ncbi:MAG: hypothetical protein HKP58_17260 [Desulfatitalea sp.]|nr:hypothetical protein [Desulfatitalea sp.]NNK02163.1 hypothetical protein [Desulfatitalea sp.]
MTIDGNYKYFQKTPMGEIEGQLELHTDGDTLTGKVTGPMGTVDIVEGKINGNELNWVVKSETGPMANKKVKFKAKVNGDALEGKVKAGILPGMTFRGTRV